MAMEKVEYQFPDEDKNDTKAKNDDIEIEKSSAVEIDLSPKDDKSEVKERKTEKKVETKKEVVTTSTDTKKINTEWQLLADEGSAMAQYKLASMYEKGEGLLKDFVYAHM